MSDLQSIQDEANEQRKAVAAKGELLKFELFRKLPPVALRPEFWPGNPVVREVAIVKVKP
jgi:hypothetical protein